MNTIDISGKNYAINTPLTEDTLYYIEEDYISRVNHDLDFDRIFYEMMERMNQVPIMEHKCNNCGATLEINADKHIFICKYCGSCYAIGTTNLNG